MSITIREKAYKKIKAYAKEIGRTEIGGLLLGKVEDGEITVKDAMLIDIIQTDASFEISDEALMELTKIASNDTLKSIIGWWHSHHNFGTFWSTVDDDCFERMCNLSGVCLGVVVAFKKGEMKERWRLDIKNKNSIRVSIDEIKVDYYFRNQYLLAIKEIQDDIKQFVKPDNRVWLQCPHCRGSGVLEDKTKKKYKYNQNMKNYEDFYGLDYVR